MGFGIFDVLSQSFGSKSELYGEKPIVPNAPNYVAELKKVIAGNISMIPSLTELSTKSTKLYSDLMETASPGSTARKEKVGSVIDEWLSGKVPADVQRQLQQFGAARASQTGVGADIGDAWTYVDFAQTSQGRQEAGVTAAMRWQELSRQGIFDFSKLFGDVDLAEKQGDATFNRDWLAAQVQAAPDPQARGAFDTEMAGFGMLLSIYGGGSGYGNSYKPNYGGPGDSNAQYQRGNSSYFGEQQNAINGMAPMNSYGAGDAAVSNQVNTMRPMGYW